MIDHISLQFALSFVFHFHNLPQKKPVLSSLVSEEGLGSSYCYFFVEENLKYEYWHNRVLTTKCQNCSSIKFNEYFAITNWLTLSLQIQFLLVLSSIHGQQRELEREIIQKRWCVLWGVVSTLSSMDDGHVVEGYF